MSALAVVAGPLDPRRPAGARRAEHEAAVRELLGGLLSLPPHARPGAIEAMRAVLARAEDGAWTAEEERDEPRARRPAARPPLDLPAASAA